MARLKSCRDTNLYLARPNSGCAVRFGGGVADFGFAGVLGVFAGLGVVGVVGFDERVLGAVGSWPSMEVFVGSSGAFCSTAPLLASGSGVWRDLGILWIDAGRAKCAA